MGSIFFSEMTIRVPKSNKMMICKSGKEERGNGNLIEQSIFSWAQTEIRKCQGKEKPTGIGIKRKKKVGLLNRKRK